MLGHSGLVSAPGEWEEWASGVDLLMCLWALPGVGSSFLAFVDWSPIPIRSLKQWHLPLRPRRGFSAVVPKGETHVCPPTAHR